VSKKLSLGGGGGGSSAINRKNYRGYLEKLGVGLINFEVVSIEKFINKRIILKLWQM